PLCGAYQHSERSPQWEPEFLSTNPEPPSGLAWMRTTKAGSLLTPRVSKPSPPRAQKDRKAKNNKPKPKNKPGEQDRKAKSQTKRQNGVERKNPKIGSGQIIRPSRVWWRDPN